MSFSYRYLPDIALADVAFEAEADDRFGLFAACGHALTQVMVDPASLGSSMVHTLEIEGEGLEECIRAWLEEHVYLKDTIGLLAKEYSFVPGSRDKGSHVHFAATLLGDHIDRERHVLGQDVKAVTYHMFVVREENNHFYARVVLDI